VLAAPAFEVIMSTQLPMPPFSLFAGGPFFQLMRRSRLSGDGLELVYRRTICLTLLAWLPPFVLSLAQGQAWGNSISIPFLLDAQTQARLLVALPLLVIAEFVVHQRMSAAVGQFAARRLVPEAAREKFEAAQASALRLRNSLWLEAILIALVFLVGPYLNSFNIDPVQGANWRASSAAAGDGLSPAGVWFHYASLPIFQFLLCRWYFRLIIWARFLWQVSRIDLHLVPTHPDGTGGLGFLSTIIPAFMAVAVAHGAMLSGRIAQRIFHSGATLFQFQVDAGLMVGLMFVLLLGPLLLFMPKLSRTRRAGMAEYGALAARYVNEFDGKWLRGQAPVNEPLIGSADIQSLADLANSFEVVKRMKLVPVSRDNLIWLVAYTLGPVAPLVLTMVPLEVLLKKLVSMLF
jgi:hypothetical protein